jgi:hypothetical protein
MEMPSVIDAARMVRSGDLSATELVRDSLDASPEETNSL